MKGNPAIKMVNELMLYIGIYLLQMATAPCAKITLAGVSL